MFKGSLLVGEIAKDKLNRDFESETMQLLLYMTAVDIREMFECDKCILLVSGVDEFVVQVAEGVENEEDYIGMKIPLGEGLFGYLAEEDEALLFPDVTELESYSDNEFVCGGPVMSSPLQFGADVLGLIVASRSEKKGQFTDEDFQKFTRYASRVSASIGSQRLIDIRTAELEKIKGKLENVNNELKEKSLKAERSERKFRNLVEHVNEGIIIVQEDLIKYANPNFINTVGGDFESLINTSFFGFFNDTTTERLKLNFQESLKNDQQSRKIYQLSMKSKDGKKVNIEVSCSVTTFEDDFAFLVYIHNTTERDELQEKLTKAQKLESIGQLAAGIAHEINTPTQYVSDNVRFFRDTFEDLKSVIVKYRELVKSLEEKNLCVEAVNEIKKLEEKIDLEYLLEDTPDAIDQSLDGLGRVARIVRSMKEFSHPSGGGMTSVDLNKTIETTITIAKNEYKYVAGLDLRLDPSLPSVRCDPNEINQVILNVLVNAAHAIEEAIGDKSGEKGKITIWTGKTNGFVEIRISDTGSGIPEEIRRKIFDPFFTTKEVGKGTGQGLAISRSIIEDKHNGQIKVDSEVGKGTTFIIKLPVEGKPAEAEKE